MNEHSELVTEPAESEVNGVKNCVVIPRSPIPDLIQVVRAAILEGAFVENTDEAGDDTYLVRFPGRQQEMLYEDDIRTRLWGLTS